ncbi:MAG TPA: MBL fold metallo-hydrolase [Gemmatimonadaceae bacterium]|nr:MBL fold metallo-hydrolase [Gemmatimonadaceae bacterium]
MRVRFWGTRGSVPSPGPRTVRYGGNTTCVELRTDNDELVILDAGTGIRELGRALIAGANGTPIRGDIFFTHAHWDHIQGLPFFTPAFQRGNNFTLWGNPVLQENIGVIVRQQMSPVVFPVAFDELRARIDLRELSASRHSTNGYTVHTAPVRHPGGALGFRVASTADPSSSIVFIPDNELDVFGDQVDASPPEELVAFARGAKVLIHDAMYTGTEYMNHRGWGHSSYRDAIEFAIAAEVETLVLFHHEPDRSDDELEAQLALCYRMVGERGGSIKVVAAQEGCEIVV